MREQLDLEQSLRQKAESYAHEVRGQRSCCGGRGPTALLLALLLAVLLIIIFSFVDEALDFI